MAKFEELTTFNIDDKTYEVSELSQDAKDLLMVYMQTEDDILKHRIATVQLQHALASLGNMIREHVKEIEPLPIASMERLDVTAAQALEALNSQNKRPKRVR